MRKTRFSKTLSLILLFIITFTSSNVEAFSGIEKINKGPLIAPPKPVTVMTTISEQSHRLSL